MKSAFSKEVVRSITQSAGRFAAIAIISLLGAGFYAGLRMAAPDMRIAGDAFFDGANLYDVSVMTTLGVDDGTVQALSNVEGVGAVMPAHRADAMVVVGESSYAASIESLPIEAARASDSSDGATVQSDDEAYLNRPILLEGAWPSRADECVVGVTAAEELGISIGDSLSVEKSTTDLEDTFAHTTFTVTGLVNSPAYASSGQLGVTSLGTGTVELYLYVPEGAFADDAPYTVAYLTAPEAVGKTWDNAPYDDAVGVVKARVDDIAGALGLARWHAVRDDAQAELDDARHDYETERADAEAKLADAADQLADARSQLDSAAADMASGKAELDDAARQLAENDAKLSDGEKQLADGQAQLDAKKAEYEQQAAGLDGLKSQRAELAAGIAQTQGGISQLEQQLAVAPAEQVPAIQAQIDALKATLADLQSKLAQLDAGIAALENGKVELDAAQTTLDAKRAELAAARAQLEAGRADLERGLAEYESGVAEYRSGEADYASGLAEYESNRAEAYEKFADAEAELADAQADIDDIARPDVYVMSREKNYGAAQLSSDAEGISQIATFLPFMFFLVAALVSLTSMTRMVDEERMVIGTHKALGYSRGRITSKYLVYGVLASGIGSAIGVVLFGKLLPWIIMTAYQVTYAVPTVPTPIDPIVAAKAIGLSVGITALATIGAAAASLREKPAALMLPRVPKAGKRIFLERIRPLWQRLSFSHKVTARNLLRYKRRFFMAVIGIAGCTALLMIGFGLRDAIGGVVWNQFGELVNYDVAVRVDDDATDEARADVADVMSSEAVDSSLQVCDFNMIAAGPDGDMRIEVVVPRDADALADFVTLRERVGKEPLAPKADEVILTEKAANELGLGPGDTVMLYDENDVGDATGDGRMFTVGGIAENYLGHYAYMLPGGYRAAFGEDPEYDLTYVKLAPDADGTAFSDELLSIDGVSTVSFVADKIATYQDMLDLMGTIILVVIALSAALAFVVLYNLTNINIDERVREIATLKVLGFTRGEVNAYIFREIIIMALIGALIGCVIGVPLTLYIAQAAETPQMMFGRDIAPASYVLSFVITMVFAAIVAFTMRGKLAKVNMVESLKSVE
ncbi:MAG: ABC transporter permease [Eggerthellaceae bacterium]|nr:ABC transporter permease [Eggerthellaceae bacterium]